MPTTDPHPQHPQEVEIRQLFRDGGGGADDDQSAGPSGRQEAGPP
jgi:hypothetical protein